jgi:hypothetical protein
MDNFTYRLNVNGWERTKAVWTVPQAFGDSEYVSFLSLIEYSHFFVFFISHLLYRYWPREPTGTEYVVQAVMGINHGAHGV